MAGVTRKWPTVAEVLEHATQIENWWQGDPHTFYRTVDSQVVWIHQNTVPRLLKALAAHGGWRVRDGDWRRTILCADGSWGGQRRGDSR